MRRTRFRLAVLALVASTAAGAACTSGSGSGGPLHGVNNDPDSEAGMGLNVKPGLPYELPFPPLCTATGAPAKIGSVTPWKLKGDIKIVDWGVKIGGGGEPGSEQMTVKQVGGFNHHPVTVKCSEKVKVQEFFISASTTTARSTMHGVTIRYNDGKITHVQFGVALCTHNPKCAITF